MDFDVLCPCVTGTVDDRGKAKELTVSGISYPEWEPKNLGCHHRSLFKVGDVLFKVGRSVYGSERDLYERLDVDDVKYFPKVYGQDTCARCNLRWVAVEFLDLLPIPLISTGSWDEDLSEYILRAWEEIEGVLMKYDLTWDTDPYDCGRNWSLRTGLVPVIVDFET